MNCFEWGISGRSGLCTEFVRGHGFERLKLGKFTCHQACEATAVDSTYKVRSISDKLKRLLKGLNYGRDQKCNVIWGLMTLGYRDGKAIFYGT